MNSGDEAALEQRLTVLVMDRWRALVQESVQAWMPALVARQVQEEIERLKGETVQTVFPRELVLPEGFDQLVRETFAPQIRQMASQMARAQVARDLPEVAERLILAELASAPP
ncbi:MAG: hypothetical protein H7838_04535 [Magnetococcus sp. DMHC-8]